MVPQTQKFIKAKKAEQREATNAVREKSVKNKLNMYLSQKFAVAQPSTGIDEKLERTAVKSKIVSIIEEQSETAFHGPTESGVSVGNEHVRTNSKAISGRVSAVTVSEIHTQDLAALSQQKRSNQQAQKPSKKNANQI